MDSTSKTALQIFATILVFGAFIYGLAGCWNTYGSGTTWKYEVNIDYVYENDSVVHHYTYNTQFSYNNSVVSVEPSFTASSGYINKLVLYTQVKTNGTLNEYSIFEKELINVPDRKFKVVDIKYKLISKEKH